MQNPVARFAIVNCSVLICLLLMTRSGYSADLIRVAPVNHKILLVEFDEGHIDYHGKGQDRYNGNICYYSALNVAKAMERTNYTLTSTDDEFYHSPQNPVNIGRKAKGVDFNNIYEAPREPEHIKMHWIYIEMPQALVQGKAYTLTLNELAGNTNEFSFTYDVFSLRSETIHVNQIGFVPTSTKYAYLSHFMGDFNTADHPKGGLTLDDVAGSTFHVVRIADKKILYTGEIALRTRKTNREFTHNTFNHANATLADVWECDFSEFSSIGEYKIVVENIGCSFPFEINPDVYREPFYYTIRAMFQQRSGIEKDLSYIEPGLIYHRDHHTDDAGVVMKLESNGANVEGVWGWYHDAGDWDGYTSHKRVPLALLMLYDLVPENFADGEIPNRYKLDPADAEWIEEAGNGIPDVLDEAMWLINFYRRAKDAMLAQGLGTGGVPGYVGVDAGADMPAWEDKREMKLEDENVEMTFTYAACAAWLAVCLDKANGGDPHPQRADWIHEAKNAYDWANNFGTDVKRQAIAAAALYRATGEIAYQSDFKSAKNKDTSWKNDLLYSAIPDWHFAATCFALTPENFPGLDTTLRTACRNDLIAQATTETVNTSQKRGYRLGIHENINFMLGIFSTPHISLAATACKLTGEDKFLQACYNTCDYQLGGNELNQSYVCGLGERSDPSPFRPDAWFMIDYDSQVYRNPVFPGLIAYAHHKDCDWQAGCDYNWVGDEDYSRTTAYPPIKEFPDAETRFWNRFSIAGSEYTVHQTQIQAIFAYGFLCAPFTHAYQANEPPTVVLNLAEDEEIGVESVKALAVNASADARRVEYYYDWHYIGESTDATNNFMFHWDVSTYKVRERQRPLITAVAYDDRGLISRPTDKGDRKIRLVAGSGVDYKGEGSIQHPKDMLYQNYPNPFNPQTAITYSVSQKQHVQLAAYNLQGKQVALLVDEIKEGGTHTITWDTSHLATGHYFVTMHSGDTFHTIKMAHLQ
ncbi:glycoside hydrolase family 9 protein [candidate division KSB1 bacterium]|nr:glycoside hydrolase family 9 protein [candidate division KSB1 bacterium]